MFSVSGAERGLREALENVHEVKSFGLPQKV